MNLSSNKTDKELKKLERRIKRQYGSASKDIQKIVDGYWNGYTDDEGIWHDGYVQRYAIERNKWLDGKYTDEQWIAWQKAQIGRGKRWEEMRDQIVNRTMDANGTAITYVNGKTPGIYALNHNYSLYQIENAYAGTSFSIADENTIKRMMENKNNVNFRVLKQDRIRDYNWNKSRITNALTQGIIQGEHPSKIAKRFLKVMENNQVAAIRNARTAVTSAQNAGRIDSYEKASEQGIVIEKEWVATSDSRTRESHVQANGQRVPWNSPFKLEGGELDYPGDPKGEPGEVYNCRCTMISVLPEVRKNVSEYDENLRYQEWLKDHR